jgi:5-azacytidine-induced protein 1
LNLASKEEATKVLQILEQVENENILHSSQKKHELTSSSSRFTQEYYMDRKPLSIYDNTSHDVKAKLVELELEKEESQKALELLKQVREQERRELVSGLQKVREESQKQQEEVRNQMAERIEKQLLTIEALIKDKEAMQAKLEELARDAKERTLMHEKLVKDQEQRHLRDLKTQKDAWVASEKVRKERWEQEKIREIREGTVQKLEPTIQGLIVKHKDEMHEATERH